MTTITDYTKMTKEELVKLINEKEKVISETKSTSSIKDKIKSLLTSSKWITINEIASALNTTNNVVSSYLSALRKDDCIMIECNINGTKYIRLVMTNDETTVNEIIEDLIARTEESE